jgi:hypothetical protein
MFPKENSLFGALLTSSPIVCSDFYKNSSVGSSSRYSSTETVDLMCPEESALAGFENRHTVCSDGQPELSDCIVCGSRLTVEVTVCVNSCNEISSPININSLIYSHHKCKNGSFYGLTDETVTCINSFSADNRFVCGFRMSKDESLPFNSKEFSLSYSGIFIVNFGIRKPFFNSWFYG